MKFVAIFLSLLITFLIEFYLSHHEAMNADASFDFSSLVFNPFIACGLLTGVIISFLLNTKSWILIAGGSFAGLVIFSALAYKDFENLSSYILFGFIVGFLTSLVSTIVKKFFTKAA